MPTSAYSLAQESYASLGVDTETALARLLAMLEPAARLRAAEGARDFTSRLALIEEAKTLPAGAVWDEYCRRQDVPVGADWIGEVKTYERDVLARRV